MASNRNPPAKPTPNRAQASTEICSAAARRPAPRRSAAPRDRARPRRPVGRHPAPLLPQAHRRDQQGTATAPSIPSPRPTGPPSARSGARSPSGGPTHGLVGEELGTTREDARLRWVIDPSTARAPSSWARRCGARSSACSTTAEPLLGLMDQPFTRERFWSDAKASLSAHGRGKGAPAADARLSASRRRRAVLHASRLVRDGPRDRGLRAADARACA